MVSDSILAMLESYGHLKLGKVKDMWCHGGVVVGTVT